jgi:signal transduction histidine kinase
MSQDLAAMFKRASNLIRESIAVEGCVFLDASGAVIDNIAVGPDTEEQESTSRSTSSGRMSNHEDEMPTWNIVHGEGERGRKPTSSYADSFSQGLMCEVLGYSSKFDIHASERQATPGFQFPKDTLHRLFKRYPNGGILNFEQNGSVSSGEEEHVTDSSYNSALNESASSSRNQGRKRRSKDLDSDIIKATFPGVRRLAFFPLWDTSTKTWFCGALAWTNDPLRVLDADDDMTYLAAFGNSIMAEKARLDTSMADRMKSNFISTVSHELRSPLHGILASAELLKDMSVSAAQMDVISMINICGRTLLDTIDHVLDFTELNRLRKSKLSEKKKSGDRDALKTQSQSLFQLLKQTSNMDLSLLVEEVVDSTLVGHDFGRSKSLVELKFQSQLPSSETQSSSQLRDAPALTIGSVKVIMDIDWQLSWEFSLQPGAWRRIVMNLFGNALKYTKDGYVSVSLKSMESVSKSDTRPLAILTVSDTGKGISKEFLKHHVFKPFWQEDTLATGTGLGLSIVQQIVRDLGGHIEIKSKEGRGTKVTVQIPFGLPTPTSALNHVNDDNIHLTVRRKLRGLKVHIISFEISSEMGKEAASETSQADASSDYAIRKSLRKTLKDWFEIDIVEAPSVDSADADVFLLLTDGLGTTEEANHQDGLLWSSELDRLAEANALLILCTGSASLKQRTSAMQKATRFIQQP